MLFLIAIAIFLKVISAGDYSTQCHGTATACDSPTKEQIEMYKKAFRNGGCTLNGSVTEITSFGQCAMEYNPELFKNISELTDNNQQCRDETGLQFKQPGILGDCEVFGTTFEDCFIRCSTCLRIPKFGFDPTVETIRTFAACPLLEKNNYGIST